MIFQYGYSYVDPGFSIFGIILTIIAAIWIYNDAKSRGYDGTGYALLTCCTSCCCGLCCYFIFGRKDPIPSPNITYQSNDPNNSYSWSYSHQNDKTVDLSQPTWKENPPSLSSDSYTTSSSSIDSSKSLETKTTDNNKEKFCPICGTKLVIDAKFCFNCGSAQK
jgi:hypothetical protein